MITHKLRADAQAVLANQKTFSPRLLKRIAREEDLQNELTIGHVRADYLRGQVLNVRTGRLIKSVNRIPARIAGNAIVSSIGSNVVYAGIHEFGGQTKPHRIEAKNGKSLHFFIGGKEIFARVVDHPGSKMPERSYIRAAIKDRKKERETALSDAIIETARGAA